MIPEIGHFSLWLALGVALLLATLPLAGSLPLALPFGAVPQVRPQWVALARPLTYVFGVTIVVEREAHTAWVGEMLASRPQGTIAP